MSLAPTRDEWALLHHEAELAYIEKRRDGRDWRKAWRARDRWFRRWEDWGEALFLDLQGKADAERMAIFAHKSATGFRKEVGEPLWRKVRARLSEVVPGDSWVRGAVRAYVGLSLDTGEDAGQFGLDALGIEQDFAWAHKRAMGRDLFAVRGSKVIQNAYGDHLDRLTSIIIDATHPRRPRTINEITADIRKEWPLLARWQAERIARTETAAVWEAVNLNTMVANGVTKFEWLTATGPSIGPPRTHPVDDLCLRRAAASPYTALKLAEKGGPPPAHPNCRCTLLPVLVNDDGSPWLPPAEPWVGGTLPTTPIPTPSL